MKSEITPRKASWIYTIPLVLAAGLVPLIVKLKIIPVHSSIAGFWPRGDSDADFFSYYKGTALIILSILAMISIFAGALKHKIKLKRSIIYIPMGAFALFAVLSAAFSGYKNIALFGFPGRYEGLFAVLAYLVLFFAAFNLFYEEKSIKILLACLIASSVLIFLIGIFQFWGMDFFKTSIAQNIIMPGEAGNTMYTIKSANNADALYENAIYGTLFNSNTFGMYISMLFPFSFVLAMVVKKKLHIAFAMLYSGLSFASLLGSYSRGAYAGAAVGVLMGLIMLIFKYKISWKRVLAISFSFIIVYAVMAYQSGGVINQRFISVLNTQNEEPAHRELDKVRNVKIEGGNLTLYSQFTELRVKLQNDEFSFMDDNNQVLDLKPTDNKMYTFVNEKYESYTIQVYDNLLNIMKDKSFLLFGVLDNEFVPVDSHGKVIDIKPVKSFGFAGMERFASARGYIWSRTIPMLKRTLLIGYGPDTFAMYFPQNDYMGKLNFMYDANILIDKPHNMYLQTAVNTGVISLIAFICILAYFFISGIRVYKKSNFSDNRVIYGMLIGPAITGYLVAGMFTDSTVSTAPVFWVLLGAGLKSKHYV